MTWQNSVLQQQKDQKSQLHHATKLCGFKVIYHFVENDITYDVKMAGGPHFLFLIFKDQVIVHQLAKIKKKVINGNLSPRYSLMAISELVAASISQAFS